MNNNRCVCCGEIIPEGRQVCPACEYKAKQGLGYKPMPAWKQILYIIKAKLFGR